MTLWRLEWLRLIRTRRWVALLGVYVFFGLLGPLTARYLGEIISLAGGDLNGAIIDLPAPVPADGIARYAENALQLGTLVTVMVAAGSLAFDAIPEMGIFLRTRVPGIYRVLAPRLVVTAGAVALAFVSGALMAWYETWALLGSPEAWSILAGIGFSLLFLMFVVALVAAIAQQARSVLGTVMGSIVVLLVMPLAGVAGVVGRWLPTRLTGALAGLPAGTAVPGDYLGASLVTLAGTSGLVWIAIELAARREL